ncbi:hypothetical protein ACFLUS_05225 [Chloroflexota bacterium]
MEKRELGKSVILILVGIILGNLLSQNEATQAILFRYIPAQWRSTVGLAILLVILIGLVIWVWKMEKKEASETVSLESKLDAIINKLGIPQEDIKDGKKPNSNAKE